MSHGGRIGLTLLEMALVLVSVGFMAAAVVVGRDLIRASEIKHIHQRLSEFISAANTFRGKYNCLPGDCDHADAFFPVTPEGCRNPTGADPGDPALVEPRGYAQQKTACNGDGNGLIDNLGMDQFPLNVTYFEGYGVWQQLADAGLIKGTYSGSEDANGNWTVAGYNCPQIIAGQCAFWLDADAQTFLGSFGGLTDNAGHLGAVMMTTAASTLPYVPGRQILTPEEALAYDSKYDDGLPDRGQILAEGPVIADAGCTTDSPPYTYDLSQQDHTCAFMMRSGF